MLAHVLRTAINHAFSTSLGCLHQRCKDKPQTFQTAHVPTKRGPGCTRVYGNSCYLRVTNSQLFSEVDPGTVTHGILQPVRLEGPVFQGFKEDGNVPLYFKMVRGNVTSLVCV